MRIIFMGTPEFAVPSLKELIESEHDVIAVIAQPDRPKGRGHRLTPPPTKVLAEKFNNPVLQPEKIKTDEFLKELKELYPDVICVTAYGKIIPKSILELPEHGCINVHPSLLPKYRGAAPVNWTIINGEKVTGVTIMQMDEGMDSGDILLVREVQIGNDDDAETMLERLSHIGAEMLVETLSLLCREKLKPVKQDESEVIYAPMLQKSDGEIEWKKPTEDIRNLIRGLTPWPGTFTKLGDKTLKIYKANTHEGRGRPGEIIESSKNSMIVATGDGALEILELQIEGGKRLDVKSFLSGHRVEKGAILGN
jgi:methionyl-tRNA formyltransferase